MAHDLPATGDELSVWVGFDPNEISAVNVAQYSIWKTSGGTITARTIELEQLRAEGLYRRPTERREGRLWDTISDAPMATEFAISRFLAPALAGRGWALFMDCDVLVRSDLSLLFDRLDARYAVMCVQHLHSPLNALKMDGQLQTAYARKNWSSVMAFNCSHPANSALTVDLINTVPGRDLHRFCWLDDGLIGALPQGWNWLVGHSPLVEYVHVAHFTDGGPWLDAYQDVPFADEWRALAREAEVRSSR